MFKNWEFLIVEIWGHLLIAVLLTLVLAWYLFGYSRGRRMAAEMTRLQGDLSAAKDRAASHDAELAHAKDKQDQMRDRMAGIQTKLSDALAKQDEMRAEIAQGQTKLSDAMKEKSALRAALAKAEGKLAARAEQPPAAPRIDEAQPRDRSTSELRKFWETSRDWSSQTYAKGAKAAKGLFDRAGR